MLSRGDSELRQGRSINTMTYVYGMWAFSVIYGDNESVYVDKLNKFKFSDNFEQFTHSI